MNMTIKKAKTENGVELFLEGFFDTTAANSAEKLLVKEAENEQEIILNFAKLLYITSAGIRVLLKMTKIMNKKCGVIVVKGINKEITEVFEMTGLTDILKTQ